MPVGYIAGQAAQGVLNNIGNIITTSLAPVNNPSRFSITMSIALRKPPFGTAKTQPT